MDEREMFESHFGIPVEQRRSPSAGGYAQREYQMMWAGWQAARRTTPDREAIIEECAKVCEMERAAFRANEAVWDANPALRPDEEYIADWESSACRGEEYAACIRALKTTPNGEKG